MKELTIFPTSKNLFKVSEITLEQRFFTFSLNTIFLTVSIGFWQVVSMTAWSQQLFYIAFYFPSTALYYFDELRQVFSSLYEFIFRAGITGLWFVNHESTSWSQRPKICKTSIFYELIILKYDNFKIISAGNIYLSIKWMRLIEDRKKTLWIVLACFKLHHYTSTWWIIKT